MWKTPRSLLTVGILVLSGAMTLGGRFWGRIGRSASSGAVGFPGEQQRRKWHGRQR